MFFIYGELGAARGGVVASTLRLRPRARHLRRRDAWDPSFWGIFEADGPGTWVMDRVRGVRAMRQGGSA